jgi:ABC-type sulfate/molybdate transport systems ATPase subunit
MVTHNPDLAAYGQRVIKMSDGRIEEDVTGTEMKKDIVSQQAESSKLVKATTDLNIKYNAKKKPVKSKRKLSRVKNRRSSKKRTTKK